MLLIPKNIGIASGLIVIEAQRLIEQGLSLEEIGAKLDQASLNTRVYFSVPSLEYLRKGGRISEAIYRIGSMLNIKPVLTCDENGKYVIAKKTRGWQKSLAGQIALGSAFAQQFDHVHVGICCSAPNIIYSEMEAMIKEAIPNVTDFRYVEAGSDLVVHYRTRPCWLCRIRLLKVNRLMQLRTAAHSGGCFSCKEYVWREDLLALRV